MEIGDIFSENKGVNFILDKVESTV